MSKKLKFFFGVSYLIILVIFLYFIFSQVEISKLNDFLYYKEIQITLENYIGSDLFFNLVLFFIFSVVWILLLGFGSPLLIISGVLFGKWVGTLVSVISISIGALLLYILAGFFFTDLIYKKVEKKFSKYIELFKKNEFYYFFAYRFVGGLGIPFFLQNILPVIFNMKKSNYFFSSFFGFIPSFFIFNTIGSGLNIYIKQAENFNFINLILTKEIYLPIAFFIVVVFVSTIIKKKIFYDK
tara:strand:+ start:38 stop:757 length:720 start_codon:yes stop_codon:yes gene_type:complete